MKRYVEASPRARQWFFLVAVVWAAFALFASRLTSHLPLPGSSVQDLLAQIEARTLYSLVALSLFYVLLSIVAIVLAIKTVRTGQWPPAGMAVPFRTPVREVHKPYKVWVFLALLLAAYVTHIAIAAYAAAATHSVLQETSRLVGPKP